MRSPIRSTLLILALLAVPIMLLAAYGTAGNPSDRTRIPGGSTAGGAVAVADGMCEIAIGSDTGGSVRLPAGLCGVVGFKPSKQRIPTEGAFPLSYTLDSVGPLARTVAACADADAAMAGEDARPLDPAPLAGLRIGIAQGLPLRSLDETVTARVFEAINELSRAGVQLSPAARVRTLTPGSPLSVWLPRS